MVQPRQGTCPRPSARRLLGRDRLIGGSTNRLSTLQAAVADGCDYVGVGPVHCHAHQSRT